MRSRRSIRSPHVAVSFTALLLAIPAISFAQNHDPYSPTWVFPTSGQTNVFLSAPIAWQCVDRDNDPLTYDVYFGKDSPPPLVASNVTATTFRVDPLEIATTYYWMIRARDPYGATSLSAIFDFTTQVNQSPVLWGPTPMDDAHGVRLGQALMWQSYDENRATLRYDVYFGAQSPPPLVASNITTRSYAIDGQTLAHGTTYYWYIVARDDQGLEQKGYDWKFTTARVPDVNTPVPADNGCAPPAVYNPPADSSLGDSTLTLKWTVTQPNGLPMHCNLYFGESPSDPGNEMPLAVGLAPTSGTKKFSYNLHHTIKAGTRYYWQVQVRDDVEGRWGPVWSFTGCGEDAGGGELTQIREGAYPNPFNPETTIPYSVPAGAASKRVHLVIYDAMGRSVRTLVDEDQPAGAHQVVWDGKAANHQRASSGVYFCVIQVGTERRTQKLVLLK